jgi:ribosome-dependent ATPase
MRARRDRAAAVVDTSHSRSAQRRPGEGTRINHQFLYNTTRFEFLIGKQIPYIALAMLNSVLLTAFAIFVFQVPFTGSLLTYAAGVFLYVVVATAIGLVISSFMRSQIAAIFGTMLLTLLPAIQFSGLTDPVSSLQGFGAFIGRIYPTTYFINISRGAFSKGLDFSNLSGSFLPLLIAIPLLLGLGAALLKKQAN